MRPSFACGPKILTATSTSLPDAQCGATFGGVNPQNHRFCGLTGYDRFTYRVLHSQTRPAKVDCP